jgi:hypothetical protein
MLDSSFCFKQQLSGGARFLSVWSTASVKVPIFKTPFG